MDNHIKCDPEPTMTVSTHATGAAASRLTNYRLKRAAAERDAAIADAHARYAEVVRGAAGRDRSSTLALRRGDGANYVPWQWKRGGSEYRERALALTHPYESELASAPGTTPPWWLVAPVVLLQTFGYRPTARYWARRHE